MNARVELVNGNADVINKVVKVKRLPKFIKVPDDCQVCAVCMYVALFL